MPFQKGNKYGKETKRGLNKSTQDVREAIAKFAQGNVHKLQQWLDQIAQTDPAKAASLFLQVIEYHIPKLARQELTGPDGKDLFKDIRFEFGD